MGKLIIIRHGESEWNALGQWTGITDVNITEKGRSDGTKVGVLISDISIHHAYTSPLKRTHQTLDAVLEGHGQKDLPRKAHAGISERDYGEYTGLNKWEVKEKVGEETFNGIRRGWDHPIPGGETLKTVYERVVPFFNDIILPHMQQGHNVIMVAHGNSIRALIKHLEAIADYDIGDVEMNFDTVLIYDIDQDGHVTNKEVRTIDTEQTKA
jgi:2,3-bisphosphoglycerate-dependent phosphoglycerate mutase